MKSLQKIKRIKLKILQENDFILFGIVSTDPDYKLSLIFNKKFRISLKNISPVKIINDKGSELTFSRFSDSVGSPEIIYYLISNRSGKNFLLKKLKNVDYIFMIQNTDNEYSIEQITANLREIESVNAVFIIDIVNFNDKNLQYLTQ